MRIRIRILIITFDADPDPDPNFQLDKDPCDGGSYLDPQHWFLPRVVSKTDVRMHSTHNLLYRQQPGKHMFCHQQLPQQSRNQEDNLLLSANNSITITVSSDNQGEQSANHNHNEQYNNNKVIII
jgi:hypothetical protein